MNSRLQMSHFIQQHSFKQDAYRKCDICNLEFMEERKYNSHMRKHDESFQCDLCKKKITGRSWYDKHKETCEGDQRPKWALAPPVLLPRRIRRCWKYTVRSTTYIG